MNFYIFEGFVHIATICIAALDAGMMAIIIGQKIASFTVENKVVLLLSTAVLAISLLYFVIDYYGILIGIAEFNKMIRVLDMWLVVSIQFLWLFFVSELILEKDKGMLVYFIKIFYAAALITTAISYGFLMDNNYHVSGYYAILLSLSIEIAVMVTFDSLNIAFIMFILKAKGGRDNLLKFGICGCILMIAESTQGGIMGVRLISQNLMIHDINVYYIPGIRLMFALLIMWYIIKRCFLAQYQAAPQTIMNQEKPINRQVILDRILSEAGLTKQETIIANLLYAGSTYKGIAEHLFISVNTVKHHVSKIYKKIGVSSKLELIELINSSSFGEKN